MTWASMPRALSQRANQKPSRPALEGDCDTFDLASCFLRFLTPAIEQLQQCGSRRPQACLRPQAALGFRYLRIAEMSVGQ